MQDWGAAVKVLVGAKAPSESPADQDQAQQAIAHGVSESMRATAFRQLHAVKDLPPGLDVAISELLPCIIEERSGSNMLAIQFKDPRGAQQSIAIAPLLAVAAGLLVDYVAGQLKEDAALYEAQFGRRRAFDEFWRPIPRNAAQNKGLEVPDGTYVANYSGLSVIRTDGGRLSSFLVCWIAPSKDGTALLIEPLIFFSPRVRAKILDDCWWMPWTWYASEQADVIFDVALEATWTSNKGRTLNQSRIAQVSCTIDAYSVSDPSIIVFSDKASVDDLLAGHVVPESWLPRIELRPRQQAGWFNAVPQSEDVAGKVGLGTFVVDAKVTERDTSNAKEMIERAAKVLGEKRSDILSALPSN
ncbi:MAG: hypothetical protein ABL997_05890 [Planctomycetota bacterium]